MSLREAVVIPLSVFNEYKIQERGIKSSSSKLLLSKMESPAKMKLYNHHRILEKTRHELPKHSFTEKPSLEEDSILFSIPVKFKPYGKSILEFINAHPGDVGYNKKYEIRINSNFIPFSNIEKTLQFFMKNVVVTRGDDEPPGSLKLLDKLFDLGMPKSWVQIKIPTKQSERIPSRNNTVREKQGWLNWY